MFIIKAVILIAVPLLSLSQPEALKGTFQNGALLIDEEMIAGVYGTCFSGMALSTCKNNLPVYNPFNLPYYTTLNEIYGQAYCLQCCGQNVGNLDHWDLKCDLDPTSAGSVNLYGFEFRFATNRFPGDNGIVRCPIKRSCCTYDANDPLKLINCDKLYDETKLHGYVLELNVVQYEGSFTYWRGVESCKIHSIIENNISYSDLPVFTETIILNYKRAPFKPEIFHGMILLCLLSLLLYFILYFCRKSHCIICGKKLIFFIEVCQMCRFYGAQRPDPNLVKALEEKGLMMNDESTGDICCMDCSCCTARGRLQRYHSKKSAKIHAINVAAASGKEPSILEIGFYDKSLLKPISYENKSAKVGHVAEIKVDEGLLHDAVGHPMYFKPIEVKYKYGVDYKPVDPRDIFPGNHETNHNHHY
jgi:hypothetical protein